MPDKEIRTGRLEEPKFIRGFDPMSSHWRPKRGPNLWKRHFELGRQNPARWDAATGEYVGGWMLVSEIRQGGCKARLAAILRDRAGIERRLERDAPLERWQLRTITVVGTHCDRELYLRYLCTLTPEEDAMDRVARRKRWEAREALRAEKREQRAKAARDTAREEEAAAQVRIRGRRRPGA